jgi:hypothetical protein
VLKIPLSAGMERDGDDNEQRPAWKKRKRKNKSGNAAAMPMGLIIGIAAGAVALLVVIGIVAYTLMTREGPAKPKGNEQVKANDEGQQGGDRPKGGKGTIQNVRSAISRTQRESELRQLQIGYTQFCDEYKGSARTYDNFLLSIKTFASIRDAVKDGSIQVNMNARPGSSDILAYERDEDITGHLCVRANGEMASVAKAQLKTELKLP